MVGVAAYGAAACGDDAPRVPTNITLDPGSPKMAAGITLDVAASYVAVDNSTTAASDVTWSVADSRVAKVTPAAGGRAKLLGVATGTTMLEVTGRGITGTFPVTVTPAELRTIAITPPVPSIAAGTSQQLTATGTFSDMTTMNLSEMVTWSSAATATATIDNKGLLRGMVVGHATIIATLGTISGTVDAAVTAALLRTIQVEPTGESFPAGVTKQFTATGLFSDDSHQDITGDVTWSSDTASRATISATGLLTAVAVGTATIKATKGGISGTSAVTVTEAVLQSIAIDPPMPKVPVGLERQLTATGIFTDGSTQPLTDQVAWVSETSGVATVSATGLANALVVGSSVVKATKGGITGMTTLEVTDAIVTAITIAPDAPKIAAGTEREFTAKARFSDGSDSDVTTQVTWASSKEDIATISNAEQTRGLATSNIPGETTITATFVQAAGNVTGSTKLTVSDATLTSIAVTPVDPLLAKGLTLDFIAIGTFSDSSTQDLTRQVTWDSSKPELATVSNAAGSKGQARALAEGEATIKATFARRPVSVTGSSKLTVTAATVTRIDVIPVDPSLAKGLTLDFVATGTFTDGSHQDLTTQVTWASSKPDIATVSNADDFMGRATALAEGETTITATFVQASGDKTGSSKLTVTPAVLVRVDVNPVDPTVLVGGTQKFTAIAVHTDHADDVTAEVIWTSSKPEVATISDAGDTKGVATAVAAGEATISAKLASANMTGTSKLTVNEPDPELRAAR